MTPTAAVYEVTPHSFPLWQTVYAFGSFIEGVELSLPTLKSLRWEWPWDGKGQTVVVSSAKRDSPWLTCQWPQWVSQHPWGLNGHGESHSTLGDYMRYRCSGLMKKNVAAIRTSVMIRHRLCSDPFQLLFHLCWSKGPSPEKSWALAACLEIPRHFT